MGESEIRGGRRRAPRFQIRAPAEYADGLDGRGFTANLSMSGALIQSAARAEVGSRITLRFSLFPGSFEIVFRGTVVRHSDDGFAVEFIELDSSHRELLHQALPPSASA